jgi:methionine-rich copper-binding protein CopC
MHETRKAHGVKRMSAVAAMALLAVLATAAPAAAHTTLTSSDPAKGSTVAPPRQIRLTFADPVRFTGVVVEDTAGGHHESGKARADGNHVAEAVAGVLAPGVYTVGWRVVAPDGHPATGKYRFTVAGGNGAPAPSSTSSSTSSSAPGSPATPASSVPAARPARNGYSAGWWWVGLVVLVLALAGGGVAVARRRRG